MTGTTSARRTRVKICGVTSIEAAIVAADAGADAIGLVFAADSPRRIDAARAAAIVRALPPMVDAIAVFAPSPSDAGAEIDAILEGGPCLAWCQVHGTPEPAALARLAARRRVIRGIRFAEETVRRGHEEPAVAALLVDGSDGGAGTAFDHAALAAMRGALAKPLVLAGGLTPDNVAAAIHAVRPWAVDVSSGVESSPGVKDPDLVRAFCAAVRRADG